jgi:hypothetical protein
MINGLTSKNHGARIVEKGTKMIASVDGYGPISLFGDGSAVHNLSHPPRKDDYDGKEI